MIEYKMFDFLQPSGCLSEIMSQPFNKNKIIDVALFQDHRNAFYYWTKWTKKLQENKIYEIPSLITFDWHQDLCFPNNDEQKELENLDLDKLYEVAYFSWARLSHINDCQIGAAAHLNMIKDVYVICRQDKKRKGFEYTDYKGNIHRIKVFHSIKDFTNFYSTIKDDRIYYDIDLDYFVINNANASGKGNFTYMKRKEIQKYFSSSNEVINWIFKRLEGFTIATEPKCCGGLKKSNYLLNIIDNLYFTPSLFSSVLANNIQTEWKI